MQFKKREITDLDPGAAQKNEDQITDMINTKITQDTSKIMRFVKDSDYFQAPASTKYHSCFRGGLAHHCLLVAKLILNKRKLYKLSRITEEDCVIIGLFHDLCKVGFYTEEQKWYKDESIKHGSKWVSYLGWGIEDDLPLGHGEKSLFVLNGLLPDGLSDFATLAIRWHMGSPSEYAERMAFSRALELYPEIAIVMTADWEASYILESQKDLKGGI